MPKETIITYLGVYYDPACQGIFGNYIDELSAYRAKRAWQDALVSCFDMTQGFDFEMKISNKSQHYYTLSCRFVSGMGKYAFWKVTNFACPEVQYIIETAHIPLCDERYEELLTAPDLCSINEI